jgi:hypothetical protein
VPTRSDHNETHAQSQISLSIRVLSLISSSTSGLISGAVTCSKAPTPASDGNSLSLGNFSGKTWPKSSPNLRSELVWSSRKPSQVNRYKFDITAKRCHFHQRCADLRIQRRKAVWLFAASLIFMHIPKTTGTFIHSLPRLLRIRFVDSFSERQLLWLTSF